MFEIEMFAVFDLSSDKLRMLTNITANKSEAESLCLSLLSKYPSAVVLSERDAFVFGS